MILEGNSSILQFASRIVFKRNMFFFLSFFLSEVYLVHSATFYGTGALPYRWCKCAQHYHSVPEPEEEEREEGVEAKTFCTHCIGVFAESDEHRFNPDQGNSLPIFFFFSVAIQALFCCCFVPRRRWVWLRLPNP